MKYLLLLICSVSALIASECRQQQFENEHIVTWKTTLQPDAASALHRRDFPTILVGIVGGTITRVEETGEVTLIDVETGKAYWCEADGPGLHWDVNETNYPIEVMVIEIRNPNDFKCFTKQLSSNLS